MNGTVLPSSSSAMTAATPLAGRPSVSTNAGTGSKSSFGAGVSGVDTSSVMRQATLAAPRPRGKRDRGLRDGGKYVCRQAGTARRLAELAGHHVGDGGLERGCIDAALDELIPQRVATHHAGGQVARRLGLTGL